MFQNDNISKAYFSTLLLVVGIYQISLKAQTCTATISGASSFCNGGSTTFSANATGSTSFTYLWNTGATTQSINITNQGTYTVTVTGINTGGGTNIIPNSTFSSGNTGFSTDYYYNNSSGSARNYTVTNNTQVWNSLFTLSYSNCQDYSSTSDNYQLLARGSNNASYKIWYVTVPVTQNTVYDLSAWASAASSTLFSSNYALVQMEINGVLIGTSNRMSGACNWRNLTSTWNSGSNTTALVAIKNLNTSSSSDNNVLLDDITMIPRTVPGCVVTASKNVTEIPISIAEAGIDVNQCSNNIFVMAANAPISGTGTWSVVSGTAIVSYLNAANSVVTLAGTSATLRWTITNGTCTSTDDVVINNSAGPPGLFCNCGPIFGTSYGGTNTSFSNQIRELNISTGQYGNQLGNNLSHVSVAIALDSRFQRLYYAPISDGGNIYTTTIPYIYFMNNSGTITNTNVRLPGNNNYNRAGFNPVDKSVYFVSSDGTNWVKYTPTAVGTGGSYIQYTNINYSPASAEAITATNGGGDIVFDATGNAYLVTNPGHFYKVVFNDATTTVSLTYLGQITLSMTQVASLAFSSDGKLFAAGNGTDVYSINLQTLKETLVNSTTSAGTGDYSSCNFPVFNPNITTYKSFRKVSGSSGTNIQTGDIVEYTINIQNTGNISAGNVKFKDNIPAGTIYVANSTTLNNSAVADASGAMPFSGTGGDFINTYDQAVQSGALSPVPPSATVKFKVQVTATSGVISNFGTITSGDDNLPQTTNTVQFEVCYPFATITASTNPFCQGQSTTIFANETGSYLWSTGQTTQSISVSTGGTYYVTVTTPSVGSGGNIITNSNFSAGNTGFSSDYTNATSGWGVYNITSQANTFFSFALPCPEHDSKGNNMLVADGANAANQRIWYQTVSVTPNTYYDLSAWGQGIVNFNPARLFFTINGTQVGNVSTLAALDCAWQQFTAEWYSGSNTSIVIAIVNQNTDGSGNDFAIDDISMIPRTTPGCPKVGSVTVSVITPTPANAGLDLVNCNNVTFSIVGNTPAVGETGYWQVVTGLISIANANSPSTTATLLLGTTGTVRWVIEKAGCQSSDLKTLTNDQPSVGGVLSPATQSVCLGGTINTLPTLSGQTGTVLRWEYQTPSSATWVNWGGAGSTTAPSNCCFNTIGTWKIRTVVQNGSCPAVNTTPVDVVIISDPSVSITGSATICTGGFATLTANVSGGLGTPNYQWQQNISGNWTNVGTNSNTYTSGTLTANASYRVVLTQTGSGCSSTSSNFNVNVVPIPTVSIINPASIICVGGIITLNASLTDASGSCTIQWQQSANKVIWTDISGATGTTFSSPALNSTTHYKVRLICSASGCCN